MATRSTIGIIDNKTGIVTSIYCHWDGYPENNGRILVEHWSDPAKIQQLIELGHLSSLGADIGEKHDFKDSGPIHCTAYGRDRAEADMEPSTYDSLQEFLDNGEEYNYLWDGVRWNCFKGNDIKALIDLYGIRRTVTA